MIICNNETFFKLFRCATIQLKSLFYTLDLLLAPKVMEYNIIIAPTLELLASEVAGFIPQGWKLKGAILEHMNGYAQQIVRHPKDSIRLLQQKQQVSARQRRTRWIE